jgi:hypothetical protein
MVNKGDKELHFILRDTHVTTSSPTDFYAALSLQECKDHTLPLQKTGNVYTLSTIALSHQVTLSIAIERLKITLEVNDETMVNTASTSSMISDKAMHAFRNAVLYLVEQEVVDELKLTVTSEEFHSIVVDVLHRIMLAELTA